MHGLCLHEVRGTVRHAEHWPAELGWRLRGYALCPVASRVPHAVAGRPRAARPRSAPAAHQHALDRTWRSGQTPPFTPLTYTSGALLPQGWTEASASTISVVVTMALA